jgi:hypothetical protein
MRNPDGVSGLDNLLICLARYLRDTVRWKYLRWRYGDRCAYCGRPATRYHRGRMLCAFCVQELTREVN